MNTITSVNDLIQIMDEADPLEHSKIMKRLAINTDGLESFVNWSEECYTRNCIARTAEYEIILLCWDICAKTPIHGHGGEDCWVYQVHGTAVETRFEQIGECLKPTSEIILTPGKLTYMNDKMGYHNIENISNERSMTLHVYTSPIDKCEVFNDDRDCFELKTMSYDTFKGNKVEQLVS